MKKQFLFTLLLIPLLGFSQLNPVNIGTNPNDGSGDPLRVAFEKLNANDLYLEGLLNTNNYIPLTGNSLSQPITGELYQKLGVQNLAIGPFGIRFGGSGSDSYLNARFLGIANGTYQGQFNAFSLTDNRTYDIPNASGTLALTSDIPSFSEKFVDGKNPEDAVLNIGNVGIGTQEPETAFHIAKPVPSITLESLRNTGGFATDLFNVKAYKLSTDESFNIGKVGYFGNMGADGAVLGDVDIVNYLYFGAGKDVAFNNNTFRLYPDKTAQFQDKVSIGVGIGAATSDAQLTVNKHQILETADVWGNLHAKFTLQSVIDNGGYTGIGFQTSLLDNLGFSLGALRKGESGSPSFAIKQHDNSEQGIDRLFINELGYIGINTDDPQKNLDINGDAYIRNSLFYGGEKLNVSGEEGSRLYMLNNTSLLEASADNGFQIRVTDANGTGATGRLFIDALGNVGIADPTPTNTLDIQGNMRIGAGYNNRTAPTNGLLVEGNVGIGTFNPSVALEVGGNVKFNSQLQDNTGAFGTDGQVLSSNGTNIEWSNISDLEGGFLTEPDVFEEVVFNKINPAEINYTQRYSAGSLNFVTDVLGIAASGYIPVEEGEFYTLSGDGVFNSYQGGYFANNGDANAISNITFADPVSGIGKIFQVPTGQGINYVVVSLRKLNADASETTLNGTAQLELGEQATIYQPYNPEKKFIKEFLPDLNTSTELNAQAWYTYTNGSDKTNILNTKAPIFARHYNLKDKDLVVLNTGTSLTARTTEHCTTREDGNERPPLMQSNNMASILWDKMRWDNQHYRRYDYPGYFTETGTFSTSSSEAEWDDALTREALTRFSDTPNAAIDFQIPSGAFQFNFIYRTDITATSGVFITIAEGNNNVEVYDGTAWVEANGYRFSMQESTPIARDIDIPRPSDDVFETVNTASKANTQYQKRLKMRCKSASIDSRGIIKNVNIEAATPGRLMYWGVEWSLREYMITYINSARGSANSRSLLLLADNEIHGFKPDLLLSELPIHNDGAANETAYAGNGYWGRLTNNFAFRNDYELSLTNRASFYGYTPEIILFTSSIQYNFNGIDDNGVLKLGEQGDGKMMTALDKFNEAFNWVKDNAPNAGIINSAQRWVDAGNEIFGDLKTATQGSGRDGITFTNEGGHWNDTGSKIIAKTLTGLFENSSN